MDKRTIRRAARALLGYDELRPGQDEAIRSVLGGRDTLAIMPTGWGKSAIYQISAARLPGPTLVVSPLIALQKDQVETLTQSARSAIAAEVGGAAQVNSAIPAAERRQAFAQLAAGELEFLFLAPEQLAVPETLERVAAARPSLFVVDEAHCVSEWGHDFRPDYLRLGAAAEALGHPTILALTATAAPPVRQAIVERLGMREPRVIVQGFDRPNIFLAARRCTTEADKRAVLVEYLRDAERPGIVYVATRRRAEELAESLRGAGLRADSYHAGRRAAERAAAQDAFMDDGLDVIVATTAFGMGIDKPNVRFVAHYEISDSLDSYYQEIGRAGRDGEPAEATLLYRPEDLAIRRFFAGGSLDADTVARVAELVAESGGPIPVADLRAASGLSETRLMMALHRLQDAGVLALLPDGVVELMALPDDLAAAAEQAVGAEERHRRFERSRLEMMRGYAETRDCRRRFLLNYFGEELAEPCGYCDTCEAGQAVEPPGGSEPFALGSAVRHASWGAGQVMRYEGEKIVVLFDDVGYKTLDVTLAVDRGLLEAAGRLADQGQ